MKLLSQIFLVIFVTLHCFHCLSVDKELTLTRAEKEALDKFKADVVKDPNVIQEYMKNDLYLLRWIRVAKLGRRGKAEDLFKNHLKWRDENKLDTILDENFSQLEQILPIYLDGEDRSGNPVISADASQWDVRRGVISGLKDSATRYVYRAIELQSSKIREKQQQGQNVTQMQVILDLSGYNLVQHGCLNCISLYVEFIRSFIFRYPYLTDNLIFVNTPQIFETIVELLNLRRARIVRINIFGNNKEEWQKFIFNIIAPDQLPKFLGGTATEK